jgi:hypothetical protein
VPQQPVGRHLEQAHVPRAVALSPADVVRQIEAAGYKDVRDLEYDDGRWEADATSADGAAVDVELDPATGAVVLDPED